MSLVLPAVAVIAFLALAGGSSSSGSKDNTRPRNLYVGGYVDFSDGVIVDVGPDISASIKSALVQAVASHARENPGLDFNVITTNDPAYTSVEEDGISIDGVHDDNLMTYFVDVDEVNENLAYAVQFAKTGVDPLDA